MNQQEKDNFYKKASEQVKEVIGHVLKNKKHLEVLQEGAKEKLKELIMADRADDVMVQEKLLMHGKKRIDELDVLSGSPYFSSCSIQIDDKKNIARIGKFSFSEEQIYSWISPIASVRFESPGEVSYVQSGGVKVSGILEKKDQYMITDGKIVFLATESLEHPRELVYQEYFSTQKKGFILPEIVAQMEKAQDTVIRASHRGPLVISGPAGSGKTTLALHRVAYLAQSPELSAIFRSHKILVFVQDESTREYFSHILPELGITGVNIMTYADWAMRVLDLSGVQYVDAVCSEEPVQDVYEYTKQECLSSLRVFTYNTDIFALLENVYRQIFSDSKLNIFKKQAQKKILDRFDLVVLLAIFKQTHGELTMMQEYYEMKKDRSAKKKIGRLPVEYALIIFDEFQNYLPDQITLAKSTLDASYDAVMYVGDMAQQTRLGTIQSWSDIHERIVDGRMVELHKVYRNTKQILQYIRDVGYDVKIPDGVQEGDRVQEFVCSLEEEFDHLQEIVRKAANRTVGILAKDNGYLHKYRKAFAMEEHVKVMTMNQAQGVEFDTVCIVGLSDDTFVVNYVGEGLEPLAEEKKRVNKDLLYVALTRAMSELYVFGREKLSEIVQ